MNSTAPKDLPPQKNNAPEKKHRSFLKSQLPILTQLVLCTAVLAFALTARAVGGEFYASTATAYFELYNRSVLTGSSQGYPAVPDNTGITETSLIAETEVSRADKGYVLPLDSGTLTSPFGEQRENSSGQPHKGVDIGAPEGTEIHAVSGGEVTAAESDLSYGNYILLKHSSGEETLYAHCSALLVKKGDIVKAGSVIALVGSTGDSDGPHLHLELRRNGQPADPSCIIGDHYS